MEPLQTEGAFSVSEHLVHRKDAAVGKVPSGMREFMNSMALDGIEL